MRRKASKIRSLNENEAAPRTFHVRTVNGQRYALKDGYEIARCTGQAHSNALIDNCGECMGHVWGLIAVKAQ